MPKIIESSHEQRRAAAKLRRRKLRLGRLAESPDGPAPVSLSRDMKALILTIGAEESGTAFRFSREAPEACQWLRHSCPDKFHEPGLSELVVDFFRRQPTATFFDVGSLYGYFALLAFAVSKGRGNVYAFEMNPESYAALSLNVAANTGMTAAAPDAGELVAVNAAVGAAKEIARPTSYLRIHLDSTHADARVAPIDFVTIDSFSEERGVAPDLIKIDVEGYEGQILAGARNTLASERTVILLEFHSNELLGRHGYTRSGILTSLLDGGSKVYFFGHHRRGTTDHATELSPEVLRTNRDTIDKRRNELVAICRSDIRKHWPHLTLVEELPGRHFQAGSD